MPRLIPKSRKPLKKELPRKVAKLKEAYPQAEVQLWAEDEMRLGLKPLIRRVWAPKGKRPAAKTKRRYEWLYVYGFVHPKTGELYWLILPKVNVEVFSMALKHFAQEVGASKERRILLVLDQAGWHTGKEVESPEQTSPLNVRRIGGVTMAENRPPTWLSIAQEPHRYQAD